MRSLYNRLLDTKMDLKNDIKNLSGDDPLRPYIQGRIDQLTIDLQAVAKDNANRREFKRYDRERV